MKKRLKHLYACAVLPSGTPLVSAVCYDAENRPFLTLETNIRGGVDGGYFTIDGRNSAYHYYVQDYQGNNRAVTSLSGTLEQKNHYYPFGALLDISTNGDVNAYKYNGKELDRALGLNLYDYHARQYDAALGRFTTMDPMAEKYYSISPYAYCANNPVNATDPTGKDPIYGLRHGKVHWIGDDGKTANGSYFVLGKIARKVRNATKQKEKYTGDLSLSKNVIHIPTGVLMDEVLQSVEDTRLSGRENGGHIFEGDQHVTRWKEGGPPDFQPNLNGPDQIVASIESFNNHIPKDLSKLSFIWHTHPIIDNMGASNPSKRDYEVQARFEMLNFKGLSAVISVLHNAVTFYDGRYTDVEDAEIRISIDEFKKMGNQETDF